MNNKIIKVSLNMSERFKLACVQFNIDPHDFLQFLLDNIVPLGAIVQAQGVKSPDVHTAFIHYFTTIQKEPDTTDNKGMTAYAGRIVKELTTKRTCSLRTYVNFMYEWSGQLLKANQQTS